MDVNYLVFVYTNVCKLTTHKQTDCIFQMSKIQHITVPIWYVCFDKCAVHDVMDFRRAPQQGLAEVNGLLYILNLDPFVGGKSTLEPKMSNDENICKYLA